MKYAVVYDSLTGNTKMLAEEIRSVMGKPECIYFGTPEEAGTVPEAELVFAGFWTDKGNCTEKMGEFLSKMKGRKVFLFGTAGFGGAEEYFQQILDRVKMHLPEGTVLEGTFMCQGKMGMGVRKRYESMLEQNPGDEKALMLIENFDRALAHPDRQDLEKLQEKLRNMGAGR